MNIKELFGAEDPVSVEKLTLYLPDTMLDEDGRETEVPNIGLWIDTAATLLAYVNRGSTRMPPCGGKWWDDRHLTSENTSLIYSYVNQERFERDATGIAQFVHTFGRRARQKAVYVEMSGEVLFEGETETHFRSRTYTIRQYTKALDDGIALEELLDHIIPNPLP